MCSGIRQKLIAVEALVVSTLGERIESGSVVNKRPKREGMLPTMLIVTHDKSHIVELEDGSRWRIWPGDLAATLQWLPTTELQVVAVDDECCSHVLVSQTDGTRVRVITADAHWPAEAVRQHLKRG
jgi:hypothetical protein